jgi:hypothetical protein
VNLTNCFYKEKGFGSCLSVKDSGSSRLGVGNIFGSNAPFFEFQDQWSPDGSITLWEENNPAWV